MAIKDLTLIEKHLFFCNGGTCKHKGAEESTSEIRKLVSQSGLNESVHTTKTLCNGRCKDGPIIISQPDGIWFKQITADKAADFFSQYLLKGNVPERMRLFRYGDREISAAFEQEAQEAN